MRGTCISPRGFCPFLFIKPKKKKKPTKTNWKFTEIFWIEKLFSCRNSISNSLYRSYSRFWFFHSVCSWFFFILFYWNLHVSHANCFRWENLEIWSNCRLGKQNLKRRSLLKRRVNRQILYGISIFFFIFYFFCIVILLLNFSFSWEF